MLTPPPETLTPSEETPTLGVVTPTLGVETSTPPTDTPTLGTDTSTDGVCRVGSGRASSEALTAVRMTEPARMLVPQLRAFESRTVVIP